MSALNVSHFRTAHYSRVLAPLSPGSAFAPSKHVSQENSARYPFRLRTLCLIASLLLVVVTAAASSESRTGIVGEPMDGASSFRQEPGAMFFMGLTLLGLGSVARQRVGKTGSKTTNG